MSEQTIKSRPVYSRLRLDPTGRRHLLVADAEGGAIRSLSPGTSVDHFDERWTVVSRSGAIPWPGEGASHQSFRSMPHLLAALRRRLDEERMGFRLYVVGAEPFLWTVNAVASEMGIGNREIHLYACGSGARRVFCNHCRTVTDGVTTTVVACAGCHASLLVRDHFSRRLNAYAGVQVDAEAPGEIPEIEQLPA
jgi:hypothetical protein